MIDTSLTNVAQPSNPSQPGFSFFTNYAHVLLLIAQESDVRMRELAADVGITERAIQRIIEELVTVGYITIHKEGRRNRYDVRVDLSLGRTPVAHRTVGNLVNFVRDGSTQSGMETAIGSINHGESAPTLIGH